MFNWSFEFHKSLCVCARVLKFFSRTREGSNNPLLKQKAALVPMFNKKYKKMTMKNDNCSRTIEFLFCKFINSQNNLLALKIPYI